MPSISPSSVPMNPRTQALRKDVPVLAQLTPRTKRQQALAIQAEEKKEQNRIRQERAARKREASKVGWNGKPKYGEASETDVENQPSRANFSRKPSFGKGADEPNWRARSVSSTTSEPMQETSKPQTRRSSRLRQEQSSQSLPQVEDSEAIQELREKCLNLEKENSEITQELETKTEQLETDLAQEMVMVKSLKSKVSDLEAVVESVNLELKTQTDELQETLKQQKQDAELEYAVRDEKLQKIELQLNQREHDFQAVCTENDTLKDTLDITNSEMQELKESLKQQEQALDEVEKVMKSERQEAENFKKESERAMAEIKSVLASSNQEIESLKLTNEDLINQLNQYKKTVEELEEKSLADAKIRRDLHNQVQELRGNIRVYARVRPLLANEKDGADSPLEMPSNDLEQRSLVVKGEVQTSVDGRSQHAKSWNFTFDKTFRPWQSQADVFEEVGHLVQSAIDGYRVSIMAYGQTGSGKTYTMEGSGWERNEHSGLIPRAVDHIFNSLEKEEEEGWKFTIHASFLEIYNEEIRDLVHVSEEDELSSKLERMNVGTANSKMKPYEIRHTASGDTIVHGLTKVQVESVEDVKRIMLAASKMRSVAATKCNDRSSRSHSVFQLYISADHQERGEERRGLLNLVDLAGSERLKSSKAQGIHLKETQAINKSLSCLGDVIFALGNGAKHVPYRNSKLTYLLQNSLGGNSKTLMFVNVSPTAVSLGESMCSLRFGQKVNSCEIGTATRNAVHKK